MKSTADSYFAAALEHIATARQLHEAGDYYLAHYLAELAVECRLRAYLRNAERFDADHNVDQLAQKSGFYNIVPLFQRETYGVKFFEINRRWRSAHRYFTATKVQGYLFSVSAEAGAKGDLFKNSSRTLLNLSLEIINLGELKWRG